MFSKVDIRSFSVIRGVWLSWNFWILTTACGENEGTSPGGLNLHFLYWKWSWISYINLMAIEIHVSWHACSWFFTHFSICPFFYPFTDGLIGGQFIAWVLFLCQPRSWKYLLPVCDLNFLQSLGSFWWIHIFKFKWSECTNLFSLWIIQGNHF